MRWGALEVLFIIIIIIITDRIQGWCISRALPAVSFLILQSKEPVLMLRPDVLRKESLHILSSALVVPFHEWSWRWLNYVQTLILIETFTANFRL